LYVKGLLSDAQKAEVERAAEDHARIKDEIEYWKEILNAYRAIEDKIPQPSGAIYARISAGIREHEQPGLFGRFLASRKLSFAFIAAQFLIIIAMGIYIVQTRSEYRTLSEPPYEAKGTIRINVVFKEGVAEVDIRRLLLKVHARIIDGPSASGRYVIAISSPEEADKSLSLLQDSMMVELAEGAY
jgi:anti-sigma factor RsiW